MKTSYLIILFIIVAGAQIFVPAEMILGQERILEKGTLYKFKTAPIDPNDPFRGKYIVLRYDMERDVPTSETWERNEAIYISLGIDNMGFAEVVALGKQKPNEAVDFVKATVGYYQKNQKQVSFNLEFDRYYMEESKAQDAEILYVEANRNNKKEAHALVYILDGKAVLDDVIIDGKSIKDWVEE